MGATRMRSRRKRRQGICRQLAVRSRRPLRRGASHKWSEAEAPEEWQKAVQHLMGSHERTWHISSLTRRKYCASSGRLWTLASTCRGGGGKGTQGSWYWDSGQFLSSGDRDPEWTWELDAWRQARIRWPEPGGWGMWAWEADGPQETPQVWSWQRGRGSQEGEGGEVDHWVVEVREPEEH